MKAKGGILVKICGLTSPEEAEYLNRYGADMGGMVMFFPKSRRNVDEARAAEIIAALDPEIKRVAVTVSPDEDQVRAVNRLGFDLLQIHGPVTDEALAAAEIPVLKAFNVTDLDSFGRYAKLDKVAGFVFDAAGYGSGKTFDWQLLKTIDRREKLTILAGGLTPDNVAEAIRAVRPDGVDVSSGVELEGGGKDPVKIGHFINNARKCF